MIRKIVHIHEDKCNGCGACAEACHEGAIAMVDGVARLIKDDYCDGLGDCLPACPADAIEIIEREAADYDEEAVVLRMAARKAADAAAKAFGGPAPSSCSDPEGGAEAAHSSPETPHICPGSMSRMFDRSAAAPSSPAGAAAHAAPAPASAGASPQPADTASYAPQSQLQQWPCQIQLVPITAPYFHNAKLLIAADCTAFAYGNFHSEFIKDHVTLVGCPKLDFVDYSEKLTEIIKQNDIKEITLARMEVPCCGGLQNALVTALKNSGKVIPWQVKIISCDGRLLD